MKLKKFISVVLVVLGASLARPESQEVKSQNGRTDPWFCHGLQCPQYEVVEVQRGYEVRNYDKGYWVSTDVKGHRFDYATGFAFGRLFDYIQGYNDPGLEIEMTAPVLNTLSAASGTRCKDNFTMSFFVPFQYQGKAPAPVDPQVYLSETEAMTVYVAQFGGMAKEKTLASAATKLQDELRKRKIKFVEGMFYFAGYDPPFRLFNRHNEVWIVGQKAVSTGSATESET